MTFVPVRTNMYLTVSDKRFRYQTSKPLNTELAQRKEENIMSNIQFIEKDQNWQNERTNYWFEVDGESWALSDQNGELTLLDSEGYPVEDCNDQGSVKDLLIPEYEKHIQD